MGLTKISEKSGCITEHGVVEVSGVRLNYKRLFPSRGGSDERPKIVFLHEGLGSVTLWRDFPERLARAVGCEALVYDRRGHGESSGPDAERSHAYLHIEAEVFLPGVLDALGMEEVILVGHSDGGSIALIFASLFPGRTVGVITEAAHVFVEAEALSGIRRTRRGYREGDLRRRLEKYHGENTDPLFRSWSETWLAPEFGRWNIESFLPAIKSPLLVIQGEEDEYGTLAQVEAIVSQSGGPARPLAVPQCGHTPHISAGARVLAAMRDHIVENCLSSW